jgi:hypothetical protein
LQYFCGQHLDPSELSRYGTAISSRLAAGKPAVDPAQVASIVWPKQSRRKHGRTPTPLPRDPDEFLDQQAEIARARAKRAHARNQQTEHYRQLRNRAIAAAGYRCERCSTDANLELHHKHYATLGEESLADVEMLCRTCHQQETERQRALKRARWKSWGTGGGRLWS